MNISWETLENPGFPDEYLVVNLGVVKITQKNIDDSKSCPMASYPDLSVDLIYFPPSQGDNDKGHYEVSYFTSAMYVKNNIIDPYLNKLLLQGMK